MCEYLEEEWSKKDVAKLLFYTLIAVFFLCGGTAIFVTEYLPYSKAIGFVLVLFGTWHVLENIAVEIAAVKRLNHDNNKGT